MEATDSKGEPIHQTLMAKKMQRLDESPDFRPFKFRIQAFTLAFLEEVGPTFEILANRLPCYRCAACQTRLSRRKDSDEKGLPIIWYPLPLLDPRSDPRFAITFGASSIYCVSMRMGKKPNRREIIFGISKRKRQAMVNGNFDPFIVNWRGPLRAWHTVV